MDGFDFNYPEEYNAGDFGDSFQENLLNGYISNFSQISYSIEKEEPEPEEEKFTDEELEAIKKESIVGKRTGRGGFEFLSLYDLKKGFDDIPIKPLENMTVNENDIVTFDLESCDPFESGRRLYRSKYVVIKPNEINCLVGCNGAGKSTIYTLIKENLGINRYPFVSYDNLKDGGHNAMDEVSFLEDFEALAGRMTSSEGENINMNVFSYLGLVAKIIKGEITRDNHFKKYRDTDHIFLLLDAVDSGFSIDNLDNLKSILTDLIHKANEAGKNLYIIAAANSFELVRNARAWKVQESKEEYFGTDYEAYRKYIIKTRQKILKQWEKMETNKEQGDD